MFTTDSSGITTSSLLSSIDGLVHAFSTRVHGDMRNEQAKNDFYQKLGLVQYESYNKIQLHSDVINTIFHDTQITSLPDADGVVYFPKTLPMRPIILTVRSADCVPILLVSPKSRAYGVVHAGWQGTIAEIATKAINKFAENGVKPETLIVAIGAHIGACCYDAGESRAERFMNVFHNDPTVVSKENDTWHIDLGQANIKQLVAAGVKIENIDMDTTCTACNPKMLFSYRKDTEKTYGVMMGVLTWKTT